MTTTPRPRKYAKPTPRAKGVHSHFFDARWSDRNPQPDAQVPRRTAKTRITIEPASVFRRGV